MRHWLSELAFFDDLIPHPAPVNMAIDEVLLGQAGQPILRVYRWERPSVSFGYFEPWQPVAAMYPDREPVRRWTGGGVVLHGEDLTYSLLISRDAMARLPIEETYRLTHEALCAALARAGVFAEAAKGGHAKISNACFENPVLHDVVAGGRKIAGAAQRRTRFGLLHQGSIQGLKLPEDFGQILAAQLGARVDTASPEVLAEAEELARTKYGARTWLEKR